MRAVLGVVILAAAGLSQSGSLGLFTNAGDIGGPPLKGAAVYDAAAREYRITGTGTDIWGRSDQFHYVWREMSDNFAVTATTRFLTDGDPHRKASIMLRRTPDPDSAFVHFAIHGDGMPAVQFRATPGDTTNTLDFPVEGPGRFTLKLVRQGGNVNVSVAKDAGPLRELGTTVLSLGNAPLLVGLAVASHSQKALNTVLFSDVSIEPLAPPAAPPAPAPPAPPAAGR